MSMLMTQYIIVIQQVVENRGHAHRAIRLIGFAFLNAEIIDDVGFIGQSDGAAINRTKPKAFPSIIVLCWFINGVNQLMVDIDKCGRRQLFSRLEKG